MRHQLAKNHGKDGIHLIPILAEHKSHVLHNKAQRDQKPYTNSLAHRLANRKRLVIVSLKDHHSSASGLVYIDRTEVQCQIV